ncbi:MAG: hypothetical protein ACLUNO_10610 [Oscillospiraceae bacterium]
MLAAGQAPSGVFQLESAGITAVCMALRPRSSRGYHRRHRALPPRPDGEHPDDFSPARQHPESITYQHPLLEPILAVTYGCIVYQEQVIEIFRQLAGFSLGQADMIRRAMSEEKARRHRRPSAPPSSTATRCGTSPAAVANGVPEQTSPTQHL